LPILISRPTVKNAVAQIARNYMKMQMLNNLASRSTIIAEHIIAVAIHRRNYRAGDLAEARAYLTQKVRLTIVQLFKMLLRNHQSVTITYWADIQKNKDDIIFKNPRNWNLSGNYLTENTILHAHRDSLA
jgi:hypothetical protein